MWFLGADHVTLMVQSTSGEQHRKIAVAVAGSVAHATAEDDQGMLEDAGLLQSGNEVAELGAEKGLNDFKLTEPIR